MIKQFATTITSFLIHENITEESDSEIYQYGLEQLLINLRMFLIISLIAFFVDMMMETIFIFIGLIPIRMIAGGYHAKTPLRCSLLTISVYLLDLVLVITLSNYAANYYILLIGMVSFILIFRFAPVDNKNKRLNHKEFIKSKLQSRMIILILSGLCIIYILLFRRINTIVISTIIGILTAALSLVIAIMKRGGDKSETNELSS